MRTAPGPSHRYSPPLGVPRMMSTAGHILRTGTAAWKPEPPSAAAYRLLAAPASFSAGFTPDRSETPDSSAFFVLSMRPPSRTSDRLRLRTVPQPAIVAHSHAAR